MTIDVCIPRAMPDGFLDALRPALPQDVRLTVGEETPCHVLVDGVPDAAHLDASPELRAVIIPYAGVPRRTRELLADRPGVTLHNLHHNAAPTAEMAVALLLAAGKAIVPNDRALRRRDWTPRYAERRDLHCDGATVVVLGYGAIGRRVGAACRGLGMRVHAVRRAGDGANDVHGPDALGALLPEADAVVVCLPWTPETEGLLGAEELARLRDGAVVVNVGRGPIIDEAALYAELAAERLRAGIDVWYRYPDSEEARSDTAPADHPFHELDNVVMSPHRAGHSARTEELRARHLAVLLGQAARGEPMDHRVDLDRGY